MARWIGRLIDWWDTRKMSDQEREHYFAEKEKFRQALLDPNVREIIFGDIVIRKKD